MDTDRVRDLIRELYKAWISGKRHKTYTIILELLELVSKW